jgi:hypothetical protein
MKQPVATIGAAQRLIGIVTDRDLRQVTFDVALGASTRTPRASAICPCARS